MRNQRLFNKSWNDIKYRYRLEYIYNVKSCNMKSVHILEDTLRTMISIAKGIMSVKY